MNDCTTRKVMKPIDVEPSFRMPGPVGNDGINKASNHDTVNDVGDEIAPLSQGPRDEGGCSGSKNELEEPLGELVACKKQYRFKTLLGMLCSRKLIFRYLASSWKRSRKYPRNGQKSLQRLEQSPQPNTQGPQCTYPANSWSKCWRYFSTFYKEKKLEFSIHFHFIFKFIFSNLTAPASMNANPHCIKKMMMDMIRRKKWSISCGCLYWLSFRFWLNCLCELLLYRVARTKGKSSSSKNSESSSRNETRTGL